jgi:hypothetical protein
MFWPDKWKAYFVYTQKPNQEAARQLAGLVVLQPALPAAQQAHQVVAQVLLLNDDIIKSNILLSILNIFLLLTAQFKHSKM